MIFLLRKYIRVIIKTHSGQKILIPCEPAANAITYRRFFTENAKDPFVDVLKQKDWQDVLDVPKQDDNKQWKLFITKFINIFNMCFPKKFTYTDQLQEVIEELLEVAKTPTHIEPSTSIDHFMSKIPRNDDGKIIRKRCHECYRKNNAKMEPSRYLLYHM
ncbi:unnamed protein product [Acanthoscelides obtectus]|uniref:PiggyBac transposable element-derived protein domain-containing protein n=1 Tax=Acanthoscelides obtectus TaxID=200917 RepID=A0A9P0QE51_ACAOB|nr:unnamed protein product [Acanthoscelides obtectus]CAK1641455.1 hypothetical protein AOBTE_LOCUS12415 [Acanthoscelides obtectus]